MDGVSVENEAVGRRIDRLRETGAVVKFLSCEPLLGSLAAVDITAINWVIASGESGPGLRAMEASCVREIRDICTASGTAFHFRQWGGVRKKLLGREIDGRTWDESPIAA